MLRICLILSIIAAIGALVITQTKVTTKINDLTTDLDTTKNNLTTSQAAESKAKKESKEARDLAEQLTRDLGETKARVEVAEGKAIQQENRANELAKDLATTTVARNEAQQKLNQYEIVGVPPEQIKKLSDDVKKVSAERDAHIEEGKAFSRTINQLRAEVSRFKGDDVKVKLPAGLKGKILAVDPKWDFVVLDIGSNQGVLEYGEMMVNRDGKLVAKVQITSVQANRCIANVLQDWKQVDLQEGDQVLY